MEKNLGLKITVLVLCTILLLLLIIGPEVKKTIEASGTNGVVSNENPVDSSPVPHPDQSTSGAIKEEEGTSDVTDESPEPAVGFHLKYENYPLTFLYFVALEDGIPVKAGPSEEEPVIRTMKRNEKIDYVETVDKDSTWYHVTWVEKDQKKFGFIREGAITKRIFQFDKMHEMVKFADTEFTKGKLTYVSNYKNGKGQAPAYQGTNKDGEGNFRSQSAPGYFSPDNTGEFTYIGDGELMRVLSADSQFTKVLLLRNEQKYFIPNKYLDTHHAVSRLNKAIVIDRENQNQVVFEKIGEKWKVVSYSLATTGKLGKYHQPTPLGYYYAIEKRERFYYYKDGTTSIQGYAPYTIRFAGGAYVHGVPVDYKYNADGQRIDPGKVEFSQSLGTIPLSHKCVRNYTSHAKFLYDWYVPGETIVIVME